MRGLFVTLFWRTEIFPSYSRELSSSQRDCLRAKVCKVLYGGNDATFPPARMASAASTCLHARIISAVSLSTSAQRPCVSKATNARWCQVQTTPGRLRDASCAGSHRRRSCRAPRTTRQRSARSARRSRATASCPADARECRHRLSLTRRPPPRRDLLAAAASQSAAAPPPPRLLSSPHEARARLDANATLACHRQCHMTSRGADRREQQ